MTNEISFTISRTIRATLNTIILDPYKKKIFINTYLKEIIYNLNLKHTFLFLYRPKIYKAINRITKKIKNVRNTGSFISCRKMILISSHRLAIQKKKRKKIY